MNLMECLSRCENVPTNGCRGCELQGNSDCTFLVAKEARKRIKALTKELEQASGNRSNGTDLGLQFSEKRFIKKLYEELVQYQRDRRPLEPTFMIRRFDNDEINTLVHVLGAVISEPSNDPLCDPHYHRVPGEGIVGRYISRPAWEAANPWEPIAAPREPTAMTQEAFEAAVESIRSGERCVLPEDTPDIVRERVMQTAVARDVAEGMEREEEARRRAQGEGRFIRHISIDDCNSLEPSQSSINDITQEMAASAAQSLDNLLRNAMVNARSVHREREGGETHEETDLQDV